MHLDLTEVLRGPGHTVEREIQIPVGSLDEWELTSPVEGHVRVSNARRNIVVRGHATTSVALECGRCLEAYSLPLDLDLDIVVPLSVFNNMLGAAAVADDESDDGHELTQEDIAALVSEHHLNVSELVRQAIVLNVPIQLLCSSECSGLPEASLYREVGADPRWAALGTIESGDETITTTTETSKTQSPNGSSGA